MIEAETELVENLIQFVESRRDIDFNIVEFATNEIILQQGTTYRHLIIILSGQAQLVKELDQPPRSFIVDQVGVGSMLGLIGHLSQKPAMTTCIAKTAVRGFKLTRQQMEQLTEHEQPFRKIIRHLILANFLDRYKTNVTSTVQLENLALELNKQNKALVNSQKKLIQQERLATLGQMVAGLAHELNNPVSAILHAAAKIDELVSEMLMCTQLPNHHKFYHQGKEQSFMDSKTLRERMKLMGSRFSSLDRPTLRSVARMPDSALQLLAEQKIKAEDIKALVNAYEAGWMMKNVNTAGARISDLVSSLRSMAKDPQAQSQGITLKGTIEDALTVMSHKFGDIVVSSSIEGSETRELKDRSLGQVWVNLLSNAVEILKGKGEIEVSAERHPRGWLVQIDDSGPGIPNEFRQKIFDINFTTKSETNFGLGLGLTISSEIIRNKGGRIEASKSEILGGARFSVYIPD